MNTNCHTILFVETQDVKDRMALGFRLNKNNYWYSPNGIIRIARFTQSFSPYYCYYGDIYMKRVIRLWKKKTYENIQRKKEKLIAMEVLPNVFCYDIYNNIINYL
jgi:hypothetical protein